MKLITIPRVQDRVQHLAMMMFLWKTYTHTHTHRNSIIPPLDVDTRRDDFQSTTGALDSCAHQRNDSPDNFIAIASPGFPSLRRNRRQHSKEVLSHRHDHVGVIASLADLNRSQQL